MLQSTYKHFLTCKGRGVEPRIEFDKLMVNFGPVLPHSNGDEQEVVVKNPCSFPTEFYCLEFDKNFLEEEKVCLSFSISGRSIVNLLARKLLFLKYMTPLKWLIEWMQNYP